MRRRCCTGRGGEEGIRLTPACITIERGRRERRRTLQGWSRGQQRPSERAGAERSSWSKRSGAACSRSCPAVSAADDHTRTSGAWCWRRLCIRCKQDVLGMSCHPAFLPTRPCTRSYKTGARQVFGPKLGTGCNNLVQQDNYNCSTKPRASWFGLGSAGNETMFQMRAASRSLFTSAQHLLSQASAHPQRHR